MNFFLIYSIFFSWLQAKQRASIKWLLSKAYDHRTPEELKEPFYKDHDVSDFKLHKYLPIFVISTQLLMTAAMKTFSGRSYKIAISNVKVNEILEYLARIDYPLISETFVSEDLIR